MQQKLHFIASKNIFPNKIQDMMEAEIILEQSEFKDKKLDEHKVKDLFEFGFL